MSLYPIPRNLVQPGKALLLSILLIVLLFAAVEASGNHRGVNGPEGEFVYTPASFPNFGGWVWGMVFVDGQPRAGITVTMSYRGKSISVTTVEIPAIDPDPIFMFGVLPHTELSATYGSVVTLTALYQGQMSSKPIRLIPNATEHQQDPIAVMSQPDEIGVSFVFGNQPIYRNPPPIRVDQNPTTTLASLPQVHTLSAGYGHTCAVIGTTAQCWGRNDQHYQLGDDTGINRNHPIIPVGLSSGVRAIAAGQGHSCAVMWSGKVKCWGWNYYGNLGHTNGSTDSPSDVIGIDNAVDVVAGDFITCALLADTTVKCWGYNAVGQVGNGVKSEAVTSPTPVLDFNRQPLRGVTAISTEFQHVCAVANSGLFCWGNTGYQPFEDHTLLATAIIAPNSGVIGADTLLYYGGCFLKANSEVWCWNQSDLKQITGLPTDIIKVAAGAGIACAVTRHGELWCWGDNWHGLLTQGQLLQEQATEQTPMRLTFINNNVADVALGYEHLCLRTTENQIHCWGDNYFGQLGDGSAPTRPLTQPVTVQVVPGGIQQIVTAGDRPRYYSGQGGYTCVLTTTGGIQCWGSNLYGQLGNGSFALVSPQATNVVSLTSGVLQIASGDFHSCAVDGSRKVWCWGRNNKGQLGNGTMTNSSLPVAVDLGPQEVQSIASGGSYSCAILSGGAVKCWGENADGQLGTGNRLSSPIPVDVIQLAGPARSLSLSYNHTCVLLESGAAQCWGINSRGEIGIYSDTLVSTVPITVPGMTSGVTDLATRLYNSCAIQQGETKCWGLWEQPTATENKLIVMPPTVITGWTSSLVDIQFTGSLCALLDNGSVQCSQLRTPDGISSYPIQQVTMTEFTNNVVALSGNHWQRSQQCVVLRDGTARCRGDDQSSQLGTGELHVKHTPVQAQILEPAQWTYMLYLVGDNDLSSYLDNIAKHLDRLPVTSTLNIVVIFDGNGKSDSYIWSTRGGNYRTGLNQWRVSEIDNNMGDQQTLAKFVEWVSENFPAQHYYLSIADHGRATSGTGFDTQGVSFDQSDRLTVREIGDALQAATLNGAWQLDVLHFDSCLMGLFEVAYQVKDYARYMIASQNLTAAFYPYDRYAQLALANPRIQPRDLALGIADAYANYEFLKVNQQPSTISVLDLSKVDSVFNALDVLAQAMKGDVGRLADLISAARASAQKFDSTPEGEPPLQKYFTITEQDEYVDLYDLARQLAAKGVPSAQELLTAFDASGLVVYNHAVSGKDRLSSNNYWELGQSKGVSIYFPQAPSAFDYTRYISHEVFSLTVNNQWDDFLQAYFNLLYPQPLPLAPDPGVPPVLKPSIPITSYCPGTSACLYGSVLSGEIRIDGAVVTLQTPSQSFSANTAFVMDAGEHPIYQFSSLPDSLKEGDPITLTAVYSGVAHSQSLRLALNPETKEQEVNLTFVYQPPPPNPDEPAPPNIPPVEVAVTQAALWPPAITQGEGVINFRASAATSNNSSIVEYRWHSSLDGSLGNSSSFVMPATKLSIGNHTITVIAVNEAGIASNPVALTLTINPPPLPESRAIVQVGSVTVTPGVDFDVPIHVYELPNSQQLNGANLVFYYNPTRLLVKACEVDPEQRFALGLCNSSQRGVIRLSVASSVGVTNSALLATLRLQAVGRSELTTQLEVEVQEFVDQLGQPLLFIRQPGEIRIRPVVRGDVSCDEKSGVADSVFILQYDVGQRQSATFCPLPPTTIHLPGCDVNDDTGCDIGDAQLILRCTVRDTNTLCPDSTAIRASSATQLVAPGGISISGLQENTYFVTIPLSATIQGGSFGAATIELEYDPTELTPLICEINPNQQFDYGFCNLNYLSTHNTAGVIRFNLIAAQGVSGEQLIARMTFRTIPQADGHAEMALRVIKALDLQGENLVVNLADPLTIQPATDHIVRSVYLPWVQK